MPAQGELRGFCTCLPDGTLMKDCGLPEHRQQARHGGGDWDTHASDLQPFMELNPGEPCALCRHTRAPVGLSICTPCYRLKIKIAARLTAQNAVSPEAWELSQR